MRSFPYALLYQTSDKGGVGLKRFSDLTNLDKLSEMFRKLAQKDEAIKVMQGHAIGQNYGYRYEPRRGMRSWLRSA